jgi:hypothetical protein
MSEFYHTAYIDGTTEYKHDDMNVPLGELDQAINDLHGSKYFDFMGQYLGDVLNSGATLMQGITGRQMKLKANAPGSHLYIGTTPTAQRTFAIQRNGSQVGTVTVNPGHNWGLFTVSADVQFYNGDLLQLIAPNPADASMQDLSWNIILTRPDIDLQTTTTTTTQTTTTSTTTTV